MAHVRASLKEALDEVRARIAEAASRSGRKAEDVALVVVTKGQPMARIQEAYEAGVRVVGENRVEEAEPKRRLASDLADLHWHMVGRIQSRKATRVVAAFDAVHSVDRTKLALRLDQEAQQLGRSLPVYLECNLSGEQAKAGWIWDPAQSVPEAILDEWREIALLRGLRVTGLMTMGPQAAREPEQRRIFGALRAASHVVATIPGVGRGLSMGMSDDYEAAVEEGATIVRVGRAIFDAAWTERGGPERLAERP